jgi:hypothetical protein
MDLQDIGALGEAIGGIAVIITLIYLALQIRQNTKAVRSNSFHAVTDSFNEINNLIAHDESLARIFRVGMEDLANLNEDELIRFSFMFMAPFRIFETIFYQYTNGTIDQRLWQAEKRSMQFLLSGPGSRAWWYRNPLSFTPEFRQFIESEIIVERSQSPPNQ